MKILHVITSLEVGGAELVLAQLAKSLKDKNIENVVVSVLPAGKVAEQLLVNNIRVLSLNIKSAADTFSGLLKLISIIKVEKPDVLQSWLYHANILSSLAALFAPIKNLVWGIHSNQKTNPKKSTALLIKLGGFLSRFSPKKIVYVADSSRQTHESFGYEPERSVVIPNGFNTDAFGANKKCDVRKKYNIPMDKLVVGCVGRWHPDKGLDIMLSVVAENQRISSQEVYFVFVGKGCSLDNEEFFSLRQKCSKPEFILAMGECDNVPEILTLLDIFCLPSRSEAFPLALGEAMASSTYCVATDVGDVRFLTGNLIDYAEPNNVPALTAALITAIQRSADERYEIGLQLRARVCNCFSDNKTTHRYIDLYNQLLQKL